jgi:hypothetical protein
VVSGVWHVAAAEQREAAFGGEAVANTGSRFLLTPRKFRFHDGFAADRRLALLESCYRQPFMSLRDILQAPAQLPTPSPD